MKNKEKNYSEIKELGVPLTIGELKKMIRKYPNNMDFGFINQPRQVLVEVQCEDLNYIAFQEL